MLPSSSSSLRCVRRLPTALFRSFATATEHSSSSASASSSSSSSAATSAATASGLPPLQKPQSNPIRARTRLNPQPRSTSSNTTTSSTTTANTTSATTTATTSRTGHRSTFALTSLPPNFGQNQLLSVSNSTRALLEDVVAQFRAPIRYAFAYGSGVFEQDGYTKMKEEGRTPMLDFMFAVRHPDHWHSINMSQFPGHYPLHARALGSDFVSKVQEVGPGVWFNTHVTVNGVTIKYGVTSIDNLCSDLLMWDSLYLAGRMHKPLRIIKDDARVRLTQQVNLTSALRTALLTLPAQFTERELFEKITSISYDGDPRMFLPAENRSKISNIVTKQSPQFKELYQRLAVGLPGVHWGLYSEKIEQDLSAQTRAVHVRKLPEVLRRRVVRRYEGRDGFPTREVDESAFWLKVAGDEGLQDVLSSEMRGIVRYPAAVQTVKGLVSAGVGKSLRYSAEKVGKWWRG